MFQIAELTRELTLCARLEMFENWPAASTMFAKFVSSTDNMAFAGVKKAICQVSIVVSVAERPLYARK